MFIWEKKLCVSIPSCLNVSHEIYTSYPHLMTRKYNLSKIKSIIESVHRSNYIFFFICTIRRWYLTRRTLSCILSINSILLKTYIIIKRMMKQNRQNMKKIGGPWSPHTPLPIFQEKKKTKMGSSSHHMATCEVRRTVLFLGRIPLPVSAFFFFLFPPPLALYAGSSSN